MKLGAPPLVARACFAALVIAATSPAWRVMLLGAAPTDDELLQLRCSVRAAAPNSTLVKASSASR